MVDQVSITLSPGVCTNAALNTLHNCICNSHRFHPNCSPSNASHHIQTEILSLKWNLPSWLEISFIHLPVFVFLFWPSHPPFYNHFTINQNTTISFRSTIYIYTILFRLDCFIFFAVVFTFQPEFAQPIQNISVAVGRDATFTCHVRHLGGYRVSRSCHFLFVYLYFLCRFLLYRTM